MPNNDLSLLAPDAPPANPLADLVDDPKEVLKGSLFVAGQTTPDRAAEAIKLSNTFGTTPHFAHQNLDELKKADPSKRVDLSNLVDNYPGVTSFFQKPENASVGHDDLDSLQTVDHMTRMVSGKHNFVQDLGNAAESGWNDLMRAATSFAVAHGQIDPETAVGTFSKLSQESAHLKSLEPDYLHHFHEAMQESGKSLGPALDKLKLGASELANQSLVQGLKDFGSGTISSVGSLLDLTKNVVMNPKASLYEATQMIVPFAPSLALSALGRRAGPAGPALGVGGSFLGGAPVFVGQKFNQLLEEKGIDPTNPESLRKAYSNTALMNELRNKADAYGVTFGALNALFGGLGGVFKQEGAQLLKTGVAGVAQKVAPFAAGQTLQGAGLVTSQVTANVAAGEKPDVAGALQNVPLILTQGIAHEAIGRIGKGRETITPTQHDISEPEGATPNSGEIIDIKPEQKLLPARSQYSERPTEALREVAHDTDEAVHTLQNLQALDEMGQAVKGSKVAQRVPDKIEELVQASGGDGQVFFQSGDWDQYWTKQGKSPAQIADELGLTAEYAKAKETGQDIEIPLAKYVSKVGPTESYDALLGFIKTRPNGMTFNEANDHMNNLPDVVRKISSEAGIIKDEAKEISGNVYDQMIAAGRSPEEARASSEIMESRLRARSSITGLSPKEHFARYGFEIANRDMKSLAQEPNQILNQDSASRFPSVPGAKTLKEARSILSNKMEEIVSSPEAAKAYAADPETINGKLISADIVRKMLPEYSHGKEGRTLFTESTQPHATPFAQKLLDQKISEPATSNGIFLSGGPGSGKSTFIEGSLKDAIVTSDFAYDGIMAGYEKARRNIEATMQSGRPVNIYHVYRPLAEAAAGVEGRFDLVGRPIPPHVFTEDHINAQRTFLRLYKEFKDNPNVTFEVLDNSQKKNGPGTVPELEKVSYTAGERSASEAIKNLEPIVKELFNAKELKIREIEKRYQEELSGNQGGRLSPSEEIARTSDGTRQGKSGNGDQNGSSGNVLNQKGNEGGPRGQIEFGPYKALIKLSEKADASTFIHEAFHLWTKEFQQDYVSLKGQENPTARQAQFLEDAKTMADYVGAESVETMTTEQWEKIAESGEEFLREGKAPSSALQRAFARFKTWINYLYRAFRNNKVKLSDEIRQVFDRMLAPEEEIAKETIDPLFKEPATAGMTEDQAAKYTKLQTDLKNYSEARLRSVLMKDLERQQSKDYSMGKDMIENRIRDQINNDPVYRTISLLKDGTLPDGSELPEGVFPIKLSKEAVIERYGDDYVNQLPAGIWDKKTGLDPEFVAETLGFASGEDMLHSIANAPTKESLIKELTNQGIKGVYPDLLEEPQLSNEAVKAVHNDLRSQMLHMELQHLASDNLPGLKRVIKDVARRLPTDQEVRARAETLVGAQNIQSIRPYEYELAERKAAKEAGQLLAKGDIEGAYQAKRKELLNHELYKAAISAQEVVDKSVETFKKIAKKDEALAKSRDTDLVNAARALLAQNGLGKSDKAPLDYLKSALAYAPDKFQAVSDLLSSNPKPYKQMTFEEFKALKQTFDAIWALSKSEREVELEGKKLDRDLAIEMVKQAASTFESKKKLVSYQKTLSEFEKKKIDLMRSLAAGRIVESLIDQWDRGDIQGTFRKVLFSPVNEAVERYRDAKIAPLQKLDDILKTVAPSLKAGKIVAPELGYEFADKSFLLGALLHSGNESNLSKLLRGRGWGEVDENGSLNRSRWDAFEKRMQKEGKLTKADYDFVQSVWDLFETLKPEAQKAHKDMYGYYFNEIAANGFSNPYGEYRGGYVPARADPYESEAADIREEKSALEKNENTWAFPTTGRGFTKNRVEAYAAPLQLALNQIKSALDFELRFIHIEPGVKQTAKLLFNPEMRSAINSLNPYATREVLIPWLQRTANQVVTTPSSSKILDRFFKQLKSAATLQFLFLDVSNAAQQLTGFLPALLKVPGGHLRDSIFSYIASPRKATAKVQEKSAFMRAHTSDQLTHIEESIYSMSVNPSKVEIANDLIKKSASFLSRTTQHVVDVSVWTAAYNHEIASSDKSIPPEVMEKNAVRAGDRAVRLTQGSGFPEHVSRWATGTPGQAIFKMFMNYFNMLGNLNLSEQLQAKERRATGRQIYAGLVGFVAVSIAAKIIGSAFSGNMDKNDDGNYADDLLKDGFLSLIGTGLSTVPGGNIVNSSIYGLTKSNPSDVRLSFSPAIAAAEKGIKGLVETKNAIEKHRALKGQELQDLMTLLGTATGLPLAPLARPLSYGMDVSNRRIKAPSNPIDAVRGIVTGKGKPIKK